MEKKVYGEDECRLQASGMAKQPKEPDRASALVNRKYP